MRNHRHMGAHEVATLLGVTRQRVHQLRDIWPDFPQPADELARGPIWHADDIEAWQAKHPDRSTATRVVSRPTRRRQRD